MAEARASGTDDNRAFTPRELSDAYNRRCSVRQTASSSKGTGVCSYSDFLEQRQCRPRGSEFVPGAGDSELDDESASPTSPQNVAARLFHLDGFNLTQVSDMIGDKSSFSTALRREYMLLFDFTGLSIVSALRVMLHAFPLMGEASKIECILKGFAERYAHQTPHCISDTVVVGQRTRTATAAAAAAVAQAAPRSEDVDSVDNIFVLATSAIMLNGDIYNKNNRSKMRADQYVRNLGGLLGADEDGENGIDFPESLLRGIYNDVIHNEIVQAGMHAAFTKAHQQRVFTQKLVKCMPYSLEYSRSFGQHRADADLIFSLQEPLGTVAASGILERAVVATGLAQPPKVQHRLKWKRKRMSLLGSRLLYHQVHTSSDVKAVSQLTRDLRATFLVRHTYSEMVMVTSDHAPGNHTFSLRHPDGRVWWFRTKVFDSAQAWVKALNETAALTSAPPIPSGVGRDGGFNPPLYAHGQCRPESLEQKLDWQLKLLAKYRTQAAAGKGTGTGNNGADPRFATRPLPVRARNRGHSAMAEQPDTSVKIARAASTGPLGRGKPNDAAEVKRFHLASEIRRLEIYSDIIANMMNGGKAAAADMQGSSVHNSSGAHVARGSAQQPGRPGTGLIATSDGMDESCLAVGTSGSSTAPASLDALDAQNEGRDHHHRDHHHFSHHHRSHRHIAEHHARYSPGDMATDFDHTQHRTGDRFNGHGNRYLLAVAWL